jgi:CRP-like cAMP-binding protein
MDKAAILKKHPAFSWMSEDGLNSISRFAEVHRLDRGMLAMLTNTADTVVVVGYGMVKEMFSASHDTMIGLYGPGEAVGVESMLAGVPYPYEAQALTPSVIVAELPRRELLRTMETVGAMALAFAAETARRTLAMQQRFVLASARVEKRLASVILDLGEKFGDDLEDGSVLIPLRMKRGDFAALISVSTETATRLMSQWTKDGVLVTGADGSLTVKDPKALERIAKGLGVSSDRETPAA